VASEEWLVTRDQRRVTSETSGKPAKLTIMTPTPLLLRKC